MKMITDPLNKINMREVEKRKEKKVHTHLANTIIITLAETITTPSQVTKIEYI